MYIASELNKKRIESMCSDIKACRCPNCKSLVYPKFVNYFSIGRSGLYWCPVCYKGKAGMFWEEV
jgi:hypothetical protein